VKAKKDFRESLQKLLQGIIKKHKRVIYNGDNYTEAWHAEAKKRGLPNLKSTPESLAVMYGDRVVKLFEKHGVLSKRELLSRNEVYMHTYKAVVRLEANCAVTIAKTMVLPVVVDYQKELALMIKSVEGVGKTNKTNTAKGLLKEVCQNTEQMMADLKKLESAIDAGASDKMLGAMAHLREVVDTLEGLAPNQNWPLPSYAEMLFVS
jgi:glutamine synthetase